MHETEVQIAAVWRSKRWVKAPAGAKVKISQNWSNAPSGGRPKEEEG